MEQDTNVEENAPVLNAEVIQDPFRVEAETLTVVSGFVVRSNNNASNSAYLQAGGSGEQRASYSFAGADGAYDITIGHFDESDGQSTMSLLVNGSLAGSFVWDQDAGDAVANESAFATYTINGVPLVAGDLVEIVGTKNGGEPLRTDYLDFTFVGAGGGDTLAPFVSASSAPNIGISDAGTTSTEVTVTFSDNAAIDVASIDVTDLTITGPGGPLTVSAVTVDTATDGTPRTATYTIEAPGGTWDETDAGNYTVALAADAVLDTSGNGVAGNPALTTFTVDLSEPSPEPFRVEAEAMTVVAGFVVRSNSNASEGQYLQSGGSEEQRASYSFAGADGAYDITIGHFDESDGQSTMSLLVNGSLAGSFVWDQDAGDAVANESAFATYTINGVPLVAGDLVEIVGTKDGGEPLRTDYLDFTFVGAGGGDTLAPFVSASSAPDIGIADAGTTSTEVIVTFSDNAAIDVTSIDVTDLTITGPGGPLTVSAVMVDTATDGTPRTATYTIEAPGGTWDETDAGNYTVALAADAVLDTSGNGVAGNPALTTFTVDLSEPSPEPFRVEAEAMTVVAGFVVRSNSNASEGQYLQSGGSEEQRASYSFAGADGAYDITIGHFDESDGQSTMSLLVNGSLAGSFVWDQDAGDAVANESAFATYTINGVPLVAGDLVEIVGTKNGGEPLRTDYLDFTFVGAGGGDTLAPFVSASSAPDIGIADAGTTSTEVTVTFSDNAAIDVASIDVTDLTITGPGGPLTVSAVMVDTATDGTPRTATYTIEAPGGTWDETDAGNYTVALAADAVLDTSGNGVAGNPALTTFTVDLSEPSPEPFRVEAEAMTVVAGFVVRSNSNASEGQYLQSGGSEEQRASYSFAGADGAYDITIGHFDESDGQSTMSLLVNGSLAGSFVWDQDAGDAVANESAFATYTINGVPLVAGDLVEIVGTKNGGEPLRTDYLDFTFVGAGGGDTLAPFVSASSAPNIGIADAGTTSTEVTVTFSDNAAIDVASIDVTDLTITGPGGPLTVSAVMVDTATDGTPRTATYTIEAPGGTWDETDAGNYTVALAADAVLDTSGNAVDADAALVSFIADFSDPTDTIAPQVDSVVAPDLGAAEDGDPTTEITITYSDDVALDVSTLDFNDIVVTGPGGPLVLSGVTVDTNSDGSPRSATYTLNAPGGSWDATDNGTYTVELVAGKVKDTSGNSVPGNTTLATFEANLPDDGQPPTTSTGHFLGQSSGASFRYKIQIEDLGGQGVAAIRSGANDAFVYVESGDWNDNNTNEQGDGYFVFTNDDPEATADVRDFGLTSSTEIVNNPTARNGDNQLTYRIFVPEDQVGEAFNWRFRVTRDELLFDGPEGIRNDQQNDLRFNVVSVADPSITLGDLRPNGAGEEGDFNNGFARLVNANQTGNFGNNMSGIAEAAGDEQIVFSESGFYDVIVAGRSVGLHIDYFEIYRDGTNPNSGASDSVFVSDAPTSPTLANEIRDAWIEPGDSYDVADNFGDVDGDTLTFTADALPTGVTFTNGEFDVANSAPPVSDFEITVTATDDDMNTATDTFLFNVTGPNGDPPPLFRVEAESLTLVTEDLAAEANALAAGGQILRATSDTTQVATYDFTEIDGLYEFRFGVFDENDGQSEFEVLVNGTSAGSIILDADAGGSGASSDSFRVASLENIALAMGDTVTFEITRDGGEPARFDYFEVDFDGFL